MGKRGRKPNLLRNLEIVERFCNGETMGELEAAYGVSRQRIQQIYSRHGKNWTDGGTSIRAKKRKLEIKSKKDRECFRRYGCVLDQFNSIPATARLAFRAQMGTSARRGVKWKLNLWEWWSIWQSSGKWKFRGRRVGQYVMCRIGDNGSYQIGNVFIDTASNNHKDRAKNKSWRYKDGVSSLLFMC